MSKNNKDYDESDGVWRTVGGRRIFIKNGQDLASAMIESGKFKNLRSTYQKDKEKEKTVAEKQSEFYKKLSSAEKKKYDDYLAQGYSKSDIENTLLFKTQEEKMEEFGIKFASEEETKLTDKQKEAGEKLTQNAENGVREDIKSFLSGKENYDGSREDFINDLSNEWGVDKEKVEEILHEENLKHPRNFTYDKEANKNEEFTSQSTNPFYPDRAYSKEDLDKMAENKIKPMENTYSGSGWEGVNSNKNLSTKEQAKAITDAMKEKYPDVKISRKSELYSGGSSIHLDIMSSDKDLYVTDADIDKMSLQDLSDVTRSNNFNWWAKENVPGYKENKAMYSEKDVKNYAKERLAQMKKGDNQSVRGDEWYLSDYGKKVVTDLNKEANSYTYDDSDAMTDYYNHGTYMWVNIGKWDKPYQVNSSSSSDNKTIKQLNDEMLGNTFKGKGETPSIVYSNNRRIDIANNENGGKTATIWKDGKIERKTNLPENVSGDKTKDYFDKYLKELDNSTTKSTNETMNNAIREKAYKIDTTKLKGETHKMPERTAEEKASDERYANAKMMYKLTGDEKYKKEYQDEISRTTERIKDKVNKEKSTYDLSTKEGQTKHQIYYVAKSNGINADKDFIDYVYNKKLPGFSGENIKQAKAEYDKLSSNQKINNAIKEKAYQKYLKEHPGSKITFNQFKDMRK